MAEVPGFGELRDALAAALPASGFDLLGCATVAAYNATLEPALADYRLPDLGAPRALVAVVGNTRRLWPLFLAAYAQTALRDEADPLDAYSRQHIGGAAARVAERFGVGHAVRYGFDPSPRSIAVQRLAVIAGVAEASPVGLCIHPQHGPWFSLRAALVFAVDGPVASAAPPTCSRCAERPCVPARERAIAACGVPAAAITRELLAEHWRAWLAVRDACPIGRAARFGDAQLEYHYLKDRRRLLFYPE